VSLSDIRAGLGDNLETVAGIRVYEEIPDNPSMPCAVIQLSNVNYDVSFQRGATNYSFIIHLIVTRVTERRAQQKLDKFIDPGSSSIKTAVQSDSTLGGAAFDVIVTEARDMAPVTIGGIDYLAVEFTATVYAL